MARQGVPRGSRGTTSRTISGDAVGCSEFRHACVALAVIVHALGFCNGAGAQNTQKRVLTLYSTGRDARIVEVGDRELPRVIERELRASIDYYSEFLDQSRFAQP